MRNIPRIANTVISSVVLCSLLGARNTAMANLIQSGGFEECDTTLSSVGNIHVTGGWTFDNFAGVNLPGGGHAGNPNKYCRLESSGLTTSDPTASQTIEGLTVGDTYTLSWDLDLRVNTTGANGRSFGVFLDQQTFAHALFIGEQLTNGYIRNTVNFVATTTTHTIIFAAELDNRSNGGMGAADVSYNLDNVELTLAAPNVLRLGIARAGGNDVELFWATNPPNAKLVSATSLSSPVSWSDVTNVPAISGTNYSVTLRGTNIQQFFRLSP